MAMVEIRGRSSSAFVKPPYSVELRRHALWLVSPGASWRYHDGADPPPETWNQPGFDDGSWPAGPAPLGYGDSLVTMVDGGPADAHPASVAFRLEFDVDDPGRFEEAILSIVADDGAEVWLNGETVLRWHLAADAGADSWATQVVSDEFEDDWQKFSLSPATLRVGTNTLAVRVHQANPTSSDLRFDLSLLGSGGRDRPDLFGMGAEDDWILQSAYIDRLLWRNKLAYDLFQSYGGAERWAGEQVYCELTMDGDYRGVYLLGEAPRRSEGRLDLVPNLGDAASFIIKLDEEGGFHTSAVSYGEWQAVYPRATEEHSAALAEVSAYLSGWETEVLANSEGQWDYLDIDSAVDWILTEELFKNNDAYFLSIYLWRDNYGKMHFIPWDFDLTLGYPYTDCSAEGFVGRATFVDAFARSPRFKDRLISRRAELREDPLTDAAILARIGAYEATLGPALARNFERWPVDEIVLSWGGVDNWLCPASSWEEEHERVLAWIPARTAWLDAWINTF